MLNAEKFAGDRSPVTPPPPPGAAAHALEFQRKSSCFLTDVTHDIFGAGAGAETGAGAASAYGLASGVAAARLNGPRAATAAPGQRTSSSANSGVTTSFSTAMAS